MLICLKTLALLTLGTSTVLATVVATSPLQAHASENDRALETLFHGPAPILPNPAHHTFVFWVNGDADHFVTQSSSATETRTQLYRGDKFEVQDLERIARACNACNVVILHDQRGSAHWYTANKPWATYFKVFSRGREILTRHVDEIDETDPHVLSRLLEFTEAAFPTTELHLIYRGKSFRATYRPGPVEILPFDYSAPEHGYGQEQFIQSLTEARLKHRLGSLTLASCAMSSLEMAARLAPFTRYFVASEVDVLEVLNVGFRFDSILSISEWMNARWVSYQLATRMFDAFHETPVLDDALMEFPATWIDLDGMPEITARYNPIANYVRQLPRSRQAQVYFAAIGQAGLSKTASSRYIESLQRAGKSPVSMQLILEQLNLRSHDLNDMDLGLLLDLLEKHEETTEIAAKVRALKALLAKYLFVIDPSPASSKIGLSVTFQAANRLRLPPL